MTTVLLVAAVLLAVLWLGQRTLIYFPDSHVPSPVSLGLGQAEPVIFDTEDGLTLGGWFVPPSPPAGGGYSVLVFNGNGGNRAYRAPLAAGFAARGGATLLFDYRGYGNNPGLPSEEGLARDARAAYRFLVSRPEVDPTRVLFFGESLGAAVAIRLATEFAPAAMVLRSPFASLTELGERHYPALPVRWLLRDRYPSIDRIGRVQSPVLVIAGDEDRIVPLESSLKLFDAIPAGRRLVIIPGADHNDEMLAFGPLVFQAIADFLRDPDAREPARPELAP